MKVNVQDYFQNFYDTMIFHPVIGGLNVQFVKWSFFDAAYDSIIKIDKLFSTVDKNTFRQEMMALRMELIGLSFYFHNSKRDELLLAQSVFTKNYLRDNGSLEIWETMHEYNKVISESSMRFVKGDRELKAAAEFHNRSMFTMLKKILKTHESDGTDPKCIGRVCNRCTCQLGWQKEVIQWYLMSKLAERVSCSKNIKPEAQKAIIYTFMTLYQGADKAIKSVSFE